MRETRRWPSLSKRMPTLSKLVTERHNVAARYILKAVSEGQLGGSLIMTDAGSAEKMIQAGFTATYNRYIPQAILPNTDASKLRSLRPDGLIVLNADKPVERRQVYIIELKYTADTNTSLQTTRAQEQHKELESLLLAAQYKQQNIIRVPILIGVGGTIYLDTIAALNTLGISTKDAESTLTKVHIATVQWLHKIYKYKLVTSKQNLQQTRQGVG